jgi:RarD protein
VIYLGLFLQQLIAATTHLMAKSVTAEVHPVLVVLWRGVFTCIAYAVWFLLARSLVKRIDRSDWPMLVLLGAINMPINQLLFIWGVKYTTAPNAALAYALTPMFVVIIGMMFFKDRPHGRRLFGLVLAILGAVIVLLDRGASTSASHMLGNVMVLMASASWAVYTVMGRRLAVKYGPLYTTGLSFFTGLLLYLPVSLLVPVPLSMDPLILGTASQSATTSWAQLLYLGVITSGVGYAIWVWALTRLDSSQVSVFNNLQPVLTTVLALLLFGQVPSMIFLVGGVIALTGVIMTQRS